MVSKQFFNVVFHQRVHNPKKRRRGCYDKKRHSPPHAGCSQEIEWNTYQHIYRGLYHHPWHECRYIYSGRQDGRRGAICEEARCLLLFRNLWEQIWIPGPLDAAEAIHAHAVEVEASACACEDKEWEYDEACTNVCHHDVDKSGFSVLGFSCSYMTRK